MKTLLALLMCTGMLGCGLPHATIPAAAPRTAPLAERMQSYDQLAPTQQTISTHVTVSNNIVSVTQTNQLVLRSGASIYAAEDLLPAVPADSPTALAAHRSRDARRSKKNWQLGTVAVILVGAALTAVALKQQWDKDPLDDTGTPRLFWVGLGVSSVGVLGYFGAAHYNRIAARETQVAFATYGDSLRGGLGLCVDGLKLVDCANQPPGAPAEVAP